MKFEKNAAPILIVLGQSNAHAHGTKLPEAQVIKTPLKNVYGLSREYNQAYGLSDVTWTGFTTGGMNLGETQDDTCCLANYFAAMWQNAIDGGADLPDLYVIQISIGAQGVAQFESHNDNMWYAMREPILKPGVLGEVDISLYPLTTEILSLAYMNLMMAGKKPQVIGLHWNQWETECYTGSKAMNDAEANFKNIFWGFFTALGSNAVGTGIPFYLYRALSENFEPSRVERMNSILEGFEKNLADCRMIDLRKTSIYTDEPRTHGIFAEDGVHYLPEAHYEFAKIQWEDIFGKE